MKEIENNRDKRKMSQKKDERTVEHQIKKKQAYKQR